MVSVLAYIQVKLIGREPARQSCVVVFNFVAIAGLVKFLANILTVLSSLLLEAKRRDERCTEKMEEKLN